MARICLLIVSSCCEAWFLAAYAFRSFSKKIRSSGPRFQISVSDPSSQNSIMNSTGNSVFELIARNRQLAIMSLCSSMEGNPVAITKSLGHHTRHNEAHIANRLRRTDSYRRFDYLARPNCTFGNSRGSFNFATLR